MSEKKIIYCNSLKDSELKYTEYIDRHIKSVWEAYYASVDAFKAVFPKVYEDKAKFSRLINIIRSHDRSKYDPNEFHYYRARFFPVTSIDYDSEKIKKGFDIAWLHHAHTNPHHPAYWALADDNTLKIFDMPDIYIIEMLCDWMAMSKYYNSSTADYWKSESAQKLPMSDYTKSKVNEFIEWMYKNNIHTLW